MHVRTRATVNELEYDSKLLQSSSSLGPEGSEDAGDAREEASVSILPLPINSACPGRAAASLPPAVLQQQLLQPAPRKRSILRWAAACLSK